MFSSEAIVSSMDQSMANPLVENLDKLLTKYKKDEESEYSHQNTARDTERDLTQLRDLHKKVRKVTQMKHEVHELTETLRKKYESPLVHPTFQRRMMLPRLLLAQLLI